MNMDTTVTAAQKPKLPAFLPLAGAALLGAAVGIAGWYLTAWARQYCMPDEDAGGSMEVNVLFLFLPGASVALALASLLTGRLLTRRAPTAVRVAVSVVLIVVVTVLFAWWVFATRGTIDGYPTLADTCPASNIPPRWPNWIPA
ncbi:hypothetical protein ACWDR0_06600 [Streptomyces sp. NPDC003691]